MKYRWLVFGAVACALSCSGNLPNEALDENGAALTRANSDELDCVTDPPGAHAQNSWLEAVTKPDARSIDIYDRSTCSLVQSIQPPDPALDIGFGAGLALSERAEAQDVWDADGRMWIGVPDHPYKSCSGVLCALLCPKLCATTHYGILYGMALSRSGQTVGSVSAVIENPAKKEHTGFGSAIAVDDKLLAIGSPGNRRVYMFSGGMFEPLNLSGPGTFGPIAFDGDKKAYGLTGAGAEFGRKITISALPDQPIDSGHARFRRQVTVADRSTTRCFELSAEGELFNPPANCATAPTPVPTPPSPPPPPPEGCLAPPPPLAWTVSACQ
jgi:hypothetical protein